MPATIQTLQLVIAGDSSGAEAAMQSAEERLKKFSETVKQGREQDRAAIQQKAVHLAGTTVAAYAFQKAAQGAEQLATAIRTGSSASEVFGSIVEKIPIVGQFKQAGDAIRELITGEKAAVYQAEKLGAAAVEVSNKYREIAASQSMRGLHGSARDSRANQIEADAKITKLHEAQAELDKQIGEIEKHKGDLIGAGLNSVDNLTEAQHANLKMLYNEKKANAGLILETSKNTAQREKEINAASQRELFLFHRDTAQKIEETDAHIEEQALRRNGRMLESAIKKAEMLQIITRHGIINQADELARPYEKSAKALRESGDLIGARENAAKAMRIRQDADAQLWASERNTFDGITTLRLEDDRQKKEMAADNEEELKKIRNEANVAQLKARGLTLNAELAMIQQAYEEQIKTLEKKNREQNHTDYTSLTDPILNAAKQAAFEKKQSAMAEARKKYQEEEATRRISAAEKNLTIEQELGRMKIDALKEQAQFGNAAMQQAAQIAEINQQYDEKRLAMAKLLEDKNLGIFQRAQINLLAMQSRKDQAAAIARLGSGTGDITAAGGAGFEDAGIRRNFGQAQDRPEEKTNELLTTVAANTDPAVIGRALLDALTSVFRPTPQPEYPQR
jgi:hypothetical protein